MSAGLPGVGLSGIFFIASALITLPLEIARTIRGQSSLARWATVLRHLAIATAMIVSLELGYAAMHLAVDKLVSVAHDGAAHGTRLHMLPIAPVVATLGVIALLLLGAKAAQLLSRSRQSRLTVAGRKPVVAERANA
jgi:hypothetical protein